MAFLAQGAPSATARFDRVTKAWYTPAVGGGTANYQRSILPMGFCACDSPSYYPNLPSDKNGSWHCDSLTGRNYWTGRNNNNYLPNYSDGRIMGASSWQSAPTQTGWLGIVKQRYDGKLRSPQDSWQLRGTNPGVALDRTLQGHVTSGAPIVIPQTNLLSPYLTGIGKQGKPAVGVDGAWEWPNLAYRVPRVPALPPPPKMRPLDGAVEARPFAPGKIVTRASALTAEQQNRVIAFMRGMPTQTTESDQVYFEPSPLPPSYAMTH